MIRTTADLAADLAWQAMRSAGAAAEWRVEGNEAAAAYHSRNAWESALEAVKADWLAAHDACKEAVARGLFV